MKSKQNWDTGFERFRTERPGATFAEFYVAGAMAKIRDGHRMVSLGPRLHPDASGEDVGFADAGKETAQRVIERAGLKPQHRLIDYGCGSLRVGLHLMSYLDAGNYWGFDVTTDFIDIGRGLIGELIKDKQARLATINESSLAGGVAFGADVVCSNVVAYHVHPDEMAVYLDNLRTLTSKPGSILVFDAKIAAAPIRVGRAGWAWPMDHFVRGLAPLELVNMRGRAAGNDPESDNVAGAYLEFRRVR